MSVERRRFPPPWDIEEHNRSCFIVRDNNGQALSYVYYETEPGRRTAGWATVTASGSMDCPGIILMAGRQKFLVAVAAR